MINKTFGNISNKLLINKYNICNKTKIFSIKRYNFFNVNKEFSFSQKKIERENKFNLCTQNKEKSTMELIKILRAETNSPLNHIKRALEETKNSVEEAKIWLRKKGFKDAENKMGRKAETQLSSITLDEKEGLIGLNNIVCETDFVANTKIFIDFTKYFSKFIIDHKQNLKEEDFSLMTLDKYINNLDNELKGLKLNECLKYLIAKTGENCQIKNLILHKFNPENEFVGFYLHNILEENVGKKAAFVILKCGSEKITDNQRTRLKELADQVAMQIIASKPKYLNKDEIPAEELKRESELIKEGILAKINDTSIVSKNEDIDYKNLSGEKLDNLIEKKISAWIDSVSLNEQEFVIVDHDAKVSHEKTGAVVGKRGKSFGIMNLKIKEYKAFY